MGFHGPSVAVRPAVGQVSIADVELAGEAIVLAHHLIQAVAAVVREGSFEAAARALGVTPSAVSQRVKLIEERLGSVLVVRGQPCTATETGARLCRHAELMGALEAELHRDLPQLAQAGMAPGSATLRVAVNADSLGTWFVGAMARFARVDPTLLELAVDNEDHTADALRRGRVLGAVTSIASPVQGCRSRRLGALRYVATASPDFRARHFAGGLGADAFARAPCLRFDGRDELQSQWVRRLLRRDVPLPAHRVPTTQGSVDAALAGVGWSMHPRGLVGAHLEAGRLVELVPGLAIDVALYWQSARLPVPALERLGRAVVETAAEALV
jgi:LysR family transcriptional regulator, chromosome initiation inhibitor